MEPWHLKPLLHNKQPPLTTTRENSHITKAQHNQEKRKETPGASLVVQCLRFRASTAGGIGSTPGQGTKILQVTQHGEKKKKETPEPQPHYPNMLESQYGKAKAASQGFKPRRDMEKACVCV